MDHCPQSRERFGEHTCFPASCSGLHSCSEHLDGAYDTCGCNSCDGSGDERGVRIWDVIVYWAARIGTERIVAGKINDICWYGHDEGRRETSPKRSGPFMTGDLAESVESGGEVSAACLIHRATRC